MIGINNEFGKKVKLNLTQAAKVIGLSRKTLDDYYAQIKKAKSQGFDFSKHNKCKMGTLRKFVKSMLENKDISK